VFIIRDFLPNTDGRIWTNFPIGRVPDSHTFPPKRPGETFYRRIINEAAQRMKVKPETIAHRVRRIPPAVMKSWQAQPGGPDLQSGPWDYFKDKDLNGVHISIDECHMFCGKKTHHSVRHKWQSWIDEIRHQGATIEFLSQHSNKVAPEINDSAGLRRTLTATAEERDPFFKIPNETWWELRAKFLTREFDPVTRVVERKEEDEKWKETHRENFRIHKHYFQFYDSYSRPHLAGKLAKKGKPKLREWQKRNHLSLVLWFIRTNFFKIAPRVFGAVFVLWLCFGGGVSILLIGFMYLLSFVTTSNAVEQQLPAEPQVQAVYPQSDVPGTTPIQYTYPAEPPPQISAELSAELDQLRTDLARREALLSETSSQVRKLKAAQDAASAVALMTPSAVVLRSGFAYGLGDLVNFGPYAGQILESIDYENRLVSLSGGDILRLGDDGRLQLATPDQQQTPPDVSGPVPPSPPDLAGDTPPDTKREASDDVGPRHAPHGFRTLGK
jgi:hypothetical protein